METNLLLNVKCKNVHLMNYIMDIVNKKQTIPGLEISIVSEHKNESKSLDKQYTENKQYTQNYIPTPNKQSVYDGGWVDMEDKRAMQNMFDSFRI